jgi:hypothetical protein
MLNKSVVKADLKATLIQRLASDPAKAQALADNPNMFDDLFDVIAEVVVRQIRTYARISGQAAPSGTVTGTIL